MAFRYTKRGPIFLNLLSMSVMFLILIIFFFVSVAYLNLGQLLSTQGKEQEAEQILTKGSQLPGEGLKDPKAHMTAQVSAMVHLGQLYMKRGEFESAANSYRQALRHVNIYPQPQVNYD